ncbi:uncharacterized protein LOC116167943 [Photinus pyralis]|uniref:uncharacterized protein LOC116167943 n=1 Tax=Photinus pyralis TaxID=7054 RepID=UPI001266EEB7|nr:uncharacterized protein LOC116167943 [Photinus pyralis]
MSPEKSALVLFTRHRLHTSTSVKMCGLDIPIKKDYKYLGMVLDSKLIWNKHIEHIKSKCDYGTNMLKCVIKTKWGAAPVIALQFYRAYIRSILDYGSPLYGVAAVCHLRAVDRIQYNALRICIGAMKSSPVQAILVEVQDPPLYIRRNYLASKEVIKLKTFSFNSAIMKSVYQLAINNLTSNYWKFKKGPMLAEAFINTEVDVESKYSKLPIYDLDFDAIMFRPTVIFPKYNESSAYNKALLRSILGRYNNYMNIYTDGSKSSSGTGLAFLVPNTNLHYKCKIPESCSIFTAETLAIDRALKWLIEVNISQNAVILSDSKSVLAALTNLNFFKMGNSEIMCQLKQRIFTLETSKRNEKADELAKEAASGTKLFKISPFYDLVNSARKNMRLSWDLHWQDFTTKSKNHYTLIHPKVPCKTPHISNFNVTRKYAVSITRLKLNHGKFPAHLNKIGLAESPYCSCDNLSIGDLNHIFFSCKNFIHAIKQLQEILITNSIPLPVNITTLLDTHNKNIFDALVNFMNSIQMDI